MRKNLFTRKKVNDPSIDNAIRDIYDKLDKLIPVTIEELAISNFSPTIGTTTFVENANGISSLAVFTKDGWKVDVNSHYELADKNSFIPLKGTKGKTRKIIEGESLSYDDKGNIKLRNKADKKAILNVSDDGVIKVRDGTDSNFGDIQCANIKDTNGRKVMEVATVSDSDSTDHIKFSNSTTTGSPQIEPDGSGTNTHLYLRSKGTGNVSASIPSTGSFNVLDDTNVRFYVNPDDVELALLGQATHIGKIDCQNDAELRIWNTALDSPTSGNDISISADDDIYLAAGGNQIYLNAGGGNSGGFNKGSTRASFDFATADTAKLQSVADDDFHLISLGTGDITLDPGGGIVNIDGTEVITKALSSTSDGTYIGLDINFDKTGASTGTNSLYGLRIDADNTTATNGTNVMYGIYNTPTVTHAADAGAALNTGLYQIVTSNTNGTSTNWGIINTVTGADTNLGILQTVDDGGVDIKLLSSADTGDYCTISTTANGATTIQTVDDDGANADLTLNIDGEIVLGSATGFTRQEATFSDTSIKGTGGSDDTDIDFRTCNKFRLEMTADIAQMNLVFPAVSGNFILVCTTDGDHDVSAWKVWKNDASAASTTDVMWPAATLPAFTSSGIDIVTIYWDATEEQAYGNVGLKFGTP